MSVDEYRQLFRPSLNQASTLKQRFKCVADMKGHFESLSKIYLDVVSGDFEFRLSPLAQASNSHDTLSSIFQTLLLIMGYFASDLRGNVGFTLFGHKKLVFPGGYWVGRPHIYLLDFEGQMESSKANINKYGGCFGCVLGRNYFENTKDGERYLEKDLRVFDDYSAFVSQSCTLWVWTSKGKQAEYLTPDLNRGHLIYEQQATVELLEYCFILQRSLIEKIENAKSFEEVNYFRWEVSKLKVSISEASHFGEIRDFINDGLSKFGLDNIQEHISEGLSIRSDQTSNSEEKESRRVGQWLTIVFGFLAVPPLANELINPLWTWLGWQQPESEPAQKLFFVVLAMTIVVSVIRFLIWTKRKQ